MQTNTNTNNPLTNDQLIQIAPSIGATSPIKSVSDKYTFVPTLSIIDALRDVGWFPIEARQSNSQAYDGFQKHEIRLVHSSCPDTTSERVEMRLINSHNKSAAIQLLTSIYRKICGNGLMVSTPTAQSVHRHINFDFEDFLASASQLANESSVVAQRVEEFKTIDLSPDERGIFAQAAHQVAYDPESNLGRHLRPEQLLEERRYDDLGNDLWTTFNVVQENVMKGGLPVVSTDLTRTGRRRRSRTREVKSIDRSTRLNKALWELTEKMYELKTA